MILLDTDHMSVLGFPDDSQCEQLNQRLQVSADRDLATTIVSAEEQMRGSLAAIHKALAVHRQILQYERLARLLAFLASWHLVRFDQRAADKFVELRKQKISTTALLVAEFARIRAGAFAEFLRIRLRVAL